MEPELTPSRFRVVALSLLIPLLAGTVSGQRSSCSDRIIRADGVGAIRLGQRVAEVKQVCRVESDTLRHKGEGGPGRVLRGLMGTETVDAWIEADTVWRIDVTGASFRTADSLGVGTPLVTLLQDSAVRGAAGEGWLFVGPPSACGIQFMFLLSTRSPARSPFGVAVLRTLPPMRVHEVWVMPCSRRPT